MKRDNDYIRQLLFTIESADDWLQVIPGETLDASLDEQRERYHIELLKDAGLLSMVGRSTYRLTAQGHDYLDAVRDDGIWQKAKAAVAETGGNATIEIMKALASGLLKKKISQHTGIDL